MHWLKPNRPPFELTDEQRATVASLSDTPAGKEARTMYLREWHQAYCAEHMQIVGVAGALRQPARETAQTRQQLDQFLFKAHDRLFDCPRKKRQPSIVSSATC